MSGRVSPFAELTGAEKQIKWLEMQSVRLPYVRGALEKQEDISGEAAIEPQKASADPRRANASPSNTDPHTYNAAPPSAAPASADKPRARPEQSTSSRVAFQQTRHRQYDAVIARMKQAEQRVNGFSTFS